MIIQPIKCRLVNFYVNAIALAIYHITNNLDKYALKHNVSLKLAEFYKKNNFDKTLYYYKKYLEINKNDIDTTIEFAQFLTDNDIVKLSQNVCKQALKRNPNYISLLLIMCQNYIKTKDFNKVIELSEKILSFNSNEQYARKFLCEAYKELNMKEELLNEAEKIELSQLSADTLVKLSRIYLREKELEKAIKARNLFFTPKYFKEFTQFPEYIYRYYQKIWRGEDLKNKTIFIFPYFYGGIGDYIMYNRFIPIIEKEAKSVILKVSENLYDFYKYNFPNCKIIKDDEQEFKGQYDYTFHNELFINFLKSLDKIPLSEGYFNVDPQLVEKFKETGLFETKKLKVGLFYHSTTKGFLEERSIETKEIIPILENNNCKFYALSDIEPNEETKQILEKYNVTIMSEYIKNVNDTAAIMKNLDLVISIDSLCIHLAGALGVKSFLMLNYDSEWRWFYDREKTPWYNSVTIYKQITKNNWADVVERVSCEIKKINNSEIVRV